MKQIAAIEYPIPPGSFLEVVGVTRVETTIDGMNSVVRGTLEVDHRHHTPWGVVHGGLWSTAIESAASLGASMVAADRGQFAVGVDNLTDFLRPVFAGVLTATGRPVSISRTLQPWEVEIVDSNDRPVATGRVRLAYSDLPQNA